jgi:hypothetical protein
MKKYFLQKMEGRKGGRLPKRSIIGILLYFPIYFFDLIICSQVQKKIHFILFFYLVVISKYSVYFFGLSRSRKIHNSIGVVLAFLLHFFSPHSNLISKIFFLRLIMTVIPKLLCRREKISVSRKLSKFSFSKLSKF